MAYQVRSNFKLLGSDQSSSITKWQQTTFCDTVNLKYLYEHLARYLCFAKNKNRITFPSVFYDTPFLPSPPNI